MPSPSAADTLIERDYTYGSLGQLLQKNHSRQGRTDYRYDPTGRITRAMNPSYWQTLDYDAAANLLDDVHNTQHRAEQRAMREGKAPPPVRTHEVIAFNRIRHYKKHQFTYDAHGRIASKSTTDGTHHYRYDAEQRLIEVAIMPVGIGVDFSASVGRKSEAPSAECFRLRARRVFCAPLKCIRFWRGFWQK